MNTSKSILLTLLFTSTLAACTEAAETTPLRTTFASPELQELGVTTLTVRELPDHLTIVGTDGEGIALARLELTVGRYVMAEDGRSVDGRRMLVDTLGSWAVHESEGRVRLELPLPGPDHKRAFLTDATVLAALDGYDVGIDTSLATGGTELDEAPYVSCPGGWGQTTHTSAPNGCSACSHSGCAGSCKKWPTTGSFNGEYRCCSTGVAAERRCVTPVASGVNTGACGNTGPNGCATCWTEYTPGCNVYVSGSSCKLNYCVQ